ncbi:hypothetical protein BS17DRAFT_438233 [Gyrodon lividus]|nr:hypothetical protein BS17DRAFT_438233 [Gyrodon lividus]
MHVTKDVSSWLSLSPTRPPIRAISPYRTIPRHMHPIPHPSTHLPHLTPSYPSAHSRPTHPPPDLPYLYLTHATITTHLVLRRD